MDWFLYNGPHHERVKEEYLLNSLHEKLKNKVYLKHVNSKESCLFPGQTNKFKVKYIAVSF